MDLEQIILKDALWFFLSKISISFYIGEENHMKLCLGLS